MNWLVRYIRKRWLCWKYGICRWHGVLMRRGGGYEPRWICETCVKENRAKYDSMGADYELLRCRIAEQLHRDWSLPKTELRP